MDLHFDETQWALFAEVDSNLREARVRGEGHCGVCSELILGRRGRSHAQSRHTHLFDDCTKYPWSKCFKE